MKGYHRLHLLNLAVLSVSFLYTCISFLQFFKTNELKKKFICLLFMFLKSFVDIF